MRHAADECGCRVYEGVKPPERRKMYRWEMDWDNVCRRVRL
jgi:hypothetical protein